ncbi:MAG TPA: FliM/FliN family flagellar motor switch protein [Pirellulales bacterium]
MTAANPLPHGQAAHAARVSSERGPTIDQLLAETEHAIAAIEPPPATPAQRAERFAFRDFAESNAASSGAGAAMAEASELELRIELGRTQVCGDDLAELRRGSVVSLDKALNEPVDVVAHGTVVARGEVVVIDGDFCVRITALAIQDSVADAA